MSSSIFFKALSKFCRGCYRLTYYLFADEEDFEKTKTAVLAAKDRMPDFKMQPVEFEKV